MTVALASCFAMPGVDAESLDRCRRAARGDHDAIVALYSEHHAHVRAFARRLIGDEALAEDLVHDVFVDLARVLQGFRAECSVRSYLVAVAARRAHRQIRTRMRRRAMEVRLAREPVASPRTPADDLERDELADVLSRALDTLPFDQRVAFVLCEVEERTSVEVGLMLGEKDATIRARVLHAKKKLREALENRVRFPAGRGQPVENRERAAEAAHAAHPPAVGQKEAP